MLYDLIFGKKEHVTLKDVEDIEDVEEKTGSEKSTLSDELQVLGERWNAYYTKRETDSKRKATDCINNVSAAIAAEKNAMRDFVPTLSIENRKYGDFLVICNQQSATKDFLNSISPFDENPPDYEEIRLDSVADVSVTDYNINFSEDSVLESWERKLGYGYMLQAFAELDCNNDLSVELQDYLSDYFNATREIKKLKQSHRVYHVKNISELEAIICVHTKFGKYYNIRCSLFVVEKVLAAIDQILKTGQYDPKKYRGEK